MFIFENGLFCSSVTKKSVVFPNRNEKDKIIHSFKICLQYPTSYLEIIEICLKEKQK